MPPGVPPTRPPGQSPAPPPGSPPGPELGEAQRLDWLRLIRTEGVGPRTFRGLVNRYGGAGPALEALPDLARRAGRSPPRSPSPAAAEREMASAARLGLRFVAWGEPDYPRALLATDAPPPLLGIVGEAACLARPCVAIVGSRNASALGSAFAERLARGLGEAGFVVASGLARGIDARAHRGALATGTAAVLAGGHDRIYPPEHVGLVDAILEADGAVVSEMPLGWEARGRDFPRRNRIVSGLSLGVVVVEAARRSGSLITARFALEQGREVFAVPGSPLDPRAEGTNDLIRQGATLCAAVDHVVAALEPLRGGGIAPPPGGVEEAGALVVGEHLWDELDLDLGAFEPAPRAHECPPEAVGAPPGLASASARSAVATLLDLLGAAPVAADELARQSGLPMRDVQGLLLELELGGRVERRGGAVSRLP